MTPFFAMAGERALTRDADSTLPAVQRALHVLMPLLLAKGLPLNQLLRGWVRLVLATPPARWLALLSALLDTMLTPTDGSDGEAPEPAAHLHCVLLMLLHRHLWEIQRGISNHGDTAEIERGVNGKVADGAAGGASADTRADVAERDEDLLRLAHMLCAHARPEVQLRALALLLLSAPLASPAASIGAPTAGGTPAGGPAGGGVERAWTLTLFVFTSDALGSGALAAQAEASADPPALASAAGSLFDTLAAAADFAKCAVARAADDERRLWISVRAASASALEGLASLMVPCGLLGQIGELLAEDADAELRASAALLLERQLARHPEVRPIHDLGD